MRRVSRRAEGVDDASTLTDGGVVSTTVIGASFTTAAMPTIVFDSGA